MPWLFFALAAGSMAVAVTSTSMLLMVFCLLASVGLVIAATMILMAERVGSASRNEVMLIDPVELRRLREQAEARRAASQAPDAGQATDEMPRA